jgi:hypothetical protein
VPSLSLLSPEAPRLLPATDQRGGTHSASASVFTGRDSLHQGACDTEFTKKQAVLFCTCTGLYIRGSGLVFGGPTQSPLSAAR